MNWDDFIKKEQDQPYFKELNLFLDEEYEKDIIYPPRDKIFTAFKKTPYDRVKCVIIGQDPYYNPGQAMGLSFSVPEGEKIPRSLKNIYKEISLEYGTDIPLSGDLTRWAKQGVLLLNTVLTVKDGKPASHKGKGWEVFTDKCIELLEKNNGPIVYMLWGDKAKAKKPLITNKNHLVLESAHPSPLSARKFFGCGHFRACNEFLENNGQSPINWV